VRIVCSQEEEPLGTAGPIKLAKELLLAPMVNESDEKVID
jgi:NDP-sugar pyrophosphorylase family protein